MSVARRVARHACLRAALAVTLIAAGTSVAAVRPAAAQAVANVDVVVRDSSGRAVAGAQVSLSPIRSEPGIAIGRSGTSNDDGLVRLPGLPAGRATLAVRRIGFRAQERAVTLEPGSNVDAPLVVALGAVPQQLASVIVRANRRGPYTGHMADFNRRRDMGFGTFITAADIDQRHPMRTTDLLRMVPGAQVYRSGNGFTNVLRMRNSSCDPLVWIDGSPASAGYLDVDTFDPPSLAGIEIYTGISTVPVELRGPRGEGACGVIALWTRMPEPRGPRSKRPPVTAEMLARLVESATLYTAEQVDEPARLDTSVSLSVRYPDELRHARTGGDALVEFVVDTAGVVEPETVGLVVASHPLLARAARETALSARFLPARRGGRPVRQLAQLPLRWDAGK